MYSSNFHLVRLPLTKSLPLTFPTTTRSSIHSPSLSITESRCCGIGSGRCKLPHRLRPIAVINEDYMDSMFFEGGDESYGDSSYMMYSSDDDDSDTDMVVNPIGDVDLPLGKEHMETPEAALTLTAHRFTTLQQGHRKKRTQPGVMISMGLFAFLVLFLLSADWCSWKIVRLPLEPYYLTQPFSISTVLSASVGCLFVPIFDSLRIYQMLMTRRTIRHSSKRKVPTMGGLFFIPIGITVARGIAGLNSIQVNGAAVATLGFAAIGLFDDYINFSSNHSSRLPGWIKFFLQVAVGICFSFWLYTADTPTPYNMRLLVPLPPPHGLIYLGNFYLVVTTFCFVAMGTGVNLTDGLDGLLSGVSALAFIGMSIAVLPICPDLAIFGASMAGGCIGFLFHNRYKASILMGDVGSLALGGALAAMAACTGMFFPLFLSSGVFVLEMFSIIVQVFFLKTTLRLVSRLKPLHYHLKCCGVKEPLIVAGAYVLSSILAVSAGYVGLISA